MTNEVHQTRPINDRLQLAVYVGCFRSFRLIALLAICLTASALVSDAFAEVPVPHFASGPRTNSFAPIDATVAGNGVENRPTRLPPVRFQMAGHALAEPLSARVIRQPSPQTSMQTKSSSILETHPSEPQQAMTATDALLTLPMPTVSSEKAATPRVPTTTLASQTSWSHAKKIETLLDQAQHDLDCRAYAAAEGNAWNALTLASEMIDLARSEVASSGISACELLHRGRTAMEEATHFVTMARAGDTKAVDRIAASHETQVLGDHSVSPFVAVDHYLDHVRICFTPIAAGSVQAARAMDLIAAIRLGRASQTQLPGPTSLCLRRAAAGGQPHNAAIWNTLSQQLADTGLLDEARWARVQGQAIAGKRLATQAPIQSSPNGAAGQPTIVQMRPEQFAAVSRSLMAHSSTGNPAKSTPAAYQANVKGGTQNQEASPVRSTSSPRQLSTSDVWESDEPDTQTASVGPFRAVANRLKSVTSLAGWRRKPVQEPTVERPIGQEPNSVMNSATDAATMSARRPSWSLPSTKLRW